LECLRLGLEGVSWDDCEVTEEEDARRSLEEDEGEAVRDEAPTGDEFDGSVRVW
jgi:hypothetical protein